LIAHDSPAQIARHELALMRADQVASVLLQDEGVDGRAAIELHRQFPLPRDLHRLALGYLRIIDMGWFGEYGVEPFRYTVFVAGHHHVRRHGNGTSHAIRPVSRCAAEHDTRLGFE